MDVRKIFVELRREREGIEDAIRALEPSQGRAPREAAGLALSR
jgi:hypothetical protein